MAKIEPINFVNKIIEVCRKYKEVISYEVDIQDNIVAKIRIYFKTRGFIEVFYNSETNRVAYALIVDNKRILGADIIPEDGTYIPLENQMNISPVRR